VPVIPINAPQDAGTNLWTPTGIEHVVSWVVERNPESGRSLVKHEFRFTFRGETRFFGVLAMDNDSPDQIEDMVGNMVIREARRVIETQQKRGSKLVLEDVTANIQIRRELAAAMRDYIRYARRRAGTTTGRVYQLGVNVA
jgi:hypothetical protein